MNTSNLAIARTRGRKSVSMCFCHLKDFEVVELVFLSFAPRDDLAKGGEDERLEPSNRELEGGWEEESRKME